LNGYQVWTDGTPTSDFGLTLFFALSGFAITYAALDWLYRPVSSSPDLPRDRMISNMRTGIDA